MKKVIPKSAETYNAIQLTEDMINELSGVEEGDWLIFNDSEFYVSTNFSFEKNYKEP